MKALIQRVKKAEVRVDKKVIGKTEKGMLIFLGVGVNDTEKQIDYLVDKLSNLRIFEDKNEKMNLSLLDIKGEVLIVSQFTLYADCTGGRRPSFVNAAKPEIAESLYKKFVQKFRETGLKVEEGQFQAMMEVELVNDGPVTMIIERTANAKIQNEEKAQKGKEE